MSDEPFFNLVDEPWISVVGSNGVAREVSLREAFVQASDIASISGELPTQDIAILRTLLAILHRAVKGPKNVRQWIQIRDSWDETLTKINSYLDSFYDRFWLQHPQHPFFQVADLVKATRDPSPDPLTKLIVDGTASKNKPSTFATRLVDEQTVIGWNEAARWLIHAQAFDVAGNHPAAMGDPRMLPSRNVSGKVGTGWLGQIGLVHVVGNSLHETLTLNALSLKNMDDLPVWERPALTALPEGWTSTGGRGQLYRRPKGPIDLYSWPSRRIRLFGDHESVHRVFVAYGDKIDRENMHGEEPMSAWIPLDAGYIPRTHDPTRAFWRGLASLLPNVGTLSRPMQQPLLSDWIEELRKRNEFPGELVRWRAAGYEYGKQNSSIVEMFSDQLIIPLALFDDENLADLVVDSVRVSEKSVDILGNLALDLAKASGRRPSGDKEKDLAPKTRISSFAYASMDSLFREWVVSLDEGVDLLTARQQWHKSVKRLIRELAFQAIDATGPTSFAGRFAPHEKFPDDLGRAMNRFENQLRKTLPAAYARPGTTDDGASSTIGSREMAL